MAIVQPFGFFAPTGGGGGVGYGNPPYDQDLIAYYDFGDASDGSWTGGSTLLSGDSVTDLSGNGFNSTLNKGNQTWNYDSGIGKGVIKTNQKDGGYFYMDALTGGFLGLTAYTFEFAAYVWQAISNDNLIMRFDNGSSGGSRAESNIQQYPSSPPKRIGFDTITDQSNNISVGTTNQVVSAGFLHLVYTAGRGETSKVYYQGSLLGQGSATMSGTDDFDFNRTGAQQDTNAWFGTSNYSQGTWPQSIGVFRFYSSAMPASSVTANYNFYSPQF